MNPLTEQTTQTEQTEQASIAPVPVDPTNELADDLAQATLAVAANPMAKIKKQFWEMSQLEVAQDTINKVMETVNTANGILTFNFDPEKDFPDNYGLAVVPICKKNAKGVMETLGAAIGAIPDYAALITKPEGSAYAKDVVETALMAKLANAVRPRADGNVAASVPFTVEDFITSNRPDGVLVAYRKLASAYVKLLKDQGLKLMTDNILRTVLESSAFAEQQFPNIKQANWEALLDSMIARAIALDMLPGMLKDWRKTRNEAGLPSDEEVDLAGLDFAKLPKIAAKAG